MAYRLGLALAADLNPGRDLASFQIANGGKESTFCASEVAGIEPTPPAPEEQDMSAFAN